MWPNNTLDVSRRVFVDEMNILICGLSVTQITLPSVGGPQCIS